MKIKSFHWVLALVGLVLGFMLVTQFRMTREISQAPYISQPKSLAAQVKNARQERDALQNKVHDLRAQLDKAAQGPQLTSLKQELDRARIEGGLAEVSGPGVEVTLNDSNVVVQPGENPNLYVLHDEDVLKILNELKAAGAEALAINGQRLVSTSEIRCIGPTILTNKNQRLTPPFVITAVGNSNNMINSLQMRGGVIEQLEFWGIQVAVRKAPQVTVPALTGGIPFELAQPVEDKQKGAGQ